MATYRVRLERESDGRIIYQWGSLPEERMQPVIAAINRLMSWLSTAANAKQSITDVVRKIQEIAS